MCTVTTECLAYALDEGIAEGIYGGATAQWRKELLARRPRVSSWSGLLERARAEHYRLLAVCCRPAPASVRKPRAPGRRGGTGGAAAGSRGP